MGAWGQAPIAEQNAPTLTLFNCAMCQTPLYRPPLPLIGTMALGLLSATNL